MSSRRHSFRVSMLVSMLVALALTIAPLPDSVDAFRPDWVALMLIYWAMFLPQRYSVGTAWLAGIVLDVAQGTLLGQHALALSIVVFITIKFHLLMRVFPLLQLTLTISALLAVYQVLLFWINGVAGVSADGVVYWGPLISGTIIWPVVSMFMNGLRFRNG